jgi:hypothetical protein
MEQMRLCARHRLRRLRPEGRALVAAAPAAPVTILANSAATSLATSAAAAAAVAPASKYASWDTLLE